ncbi:MAG: hypothetical protein ACOYVK_20615 [Bacillota bacterium]
MNRCQMNPMNPYNPHMPMVNPHMPMMEPMYMPAAMPMVDPHHLMRLLHPVVKYGLEEAKCTSVRHAMMEVVLIAYLMGRGYDHHTAHRMVESWEVDEIFPIE